MKSSEAPLSKWRIPLAISITVSWYFLITTLPWQIQNVVSEHVRYTTGEAARIPVYAFTALLASVVLTWLMHNSGAWFAEIGPTLAVLAMAYGIFGPHCEVDLLIFAAWLLASWGFCRPEPKRVAVLLLAVILIAEIAPSPFGTPAITIR